MTSIDEIVRELRDIAGHAGHDFDAIERETLHQAANALARSRRMEEALREIRDGEPDYSVYAWKHYVQLARAALEDT